ncbi:MAG: hypothetical protein K2O63_05490 [Alistipes sp.]|nr:hypothetical protein [Alistipes sp.]
MMKFEKFLKAGAFLLSAAALFALPACSNDNEKPIDGDDTYEGIHVDYLVEAFYSTDTDATLGNYTIVVGNAIPGNDGYPANDGEIQFQLDFYAAPDKDPMNAVLPSATYQPADHAEQLTFNRSTSIMYLRAEGELHTAPIVTGEIAVSREGNIYTIHMKCGLLSGETFDARYKGTIQFTETHTSTQERFTEPQDVTLDLAQGRYYGNWFYPHADDMSLEFFLGDFDQENRFVNGYYFRTEFWMPKVENPTRETEVIITEGEYTIIRQHLSTQQQLPMRFTEGEYTDFMGMKLNTGTHLLYVDGQTGKNKVAFIKEGTINVTRSGKTYKFDCDMVSEEGVSIKVSYEGGVTIGNFVDNSQEPERPMSSLTADHKLSFHENLTAEFYNLGEYLIPGLNSWMFLLTAVEDPTDENSPLVGDMITGEFLASAADGLTLVPGTYTISKELKPFTLHPGYMPYGSTEVGYTWYGDMSSVDATGAASILAPINEGTMTVTKEGDEYKFVFDFEDDAAPSHTITGEWTGKVNIYDFSQHAVSAKLNRVSAALNR